MKVITELRKQKGLSMSALARKAEMHVSSVSQIESGRLSPYPAQIEKLATALEWRDGPSILFEEVEVETC